MKRVILCPNPYRDNDLSVAKKSKELLEEAGAYRKKHVNVRMIASLAACFCAVLAGLLAAAVYLRGKYPAVFGVLAVNIGLAGRKFPCKENRIGLQ